MNTITDTPTAAARRFLHVWTTMLGLTDRPDRPRVEQLVKDAYRAAGQLGNPPSAEPPLIRVQRAAMTRFILSHRNADCHYRNGWWKVPRKSCNADLVNPMCLMVIRLVALVQPGRLDAIGHSMMKRGLPDRFL